VRAVALPAAGARYPAGATATFTGYGSTSDGGVPDGLLRSIGMTVDPQCECGELSEMQRIMYFNGTDLCAVNPTGATCGGDSGGGLVTTASTPVLIGVFSTGAAHCDVGSRAIFESLAAPENLRFVQGSDQATQAPRPTSGVTTWNLDWPRPLAAGTTLTCSTDHWSGSVTAAYTFLTSDGKLLESGRRSTYLVPRDAVGTSIVCEVAVTNAGGTTIEKTRATPTIAAGTSAPKANATSSGTKGSAAQVSLEPLTPVTARRGRSVTLHVSLVVPTTTAGTFKACAQLPTSVWVHGGVCRSVQEPSGAHGTFPFGLTFTIQPTAPLGTVHGAITANAGTSTAKTTAILKIQH
jgi:hypothetical protein